MTKFTWLMAYDFSPSSDIVLEKTLEELQIHKGVLHVVHVLHSPSMQASHGETQFSQALHKNAKTHLEEAKSRLASAFSDVDIQTIVREGDVVEEILGTARECGVDRIVVGTHGRKGVTRMLLGSVAESVVRLAPVSVLVIKTHVG